MNAYSTNLANIEAIRKKIARLNEIIRKWWMCETQSNDKKNDESKGPQFKQEMYPSIKHGLGHTKGAKTNGRRIVNGYECVQFERKDRIGVEQPTQTVAVQRVEEPPNLMPLQEYLSSIRYEVPKRVH